MTTLSPDLESARNEFQSTGTYVARGLFSPAVCVFFIEHNMELRKEERPGDFSGVDPSSSDPLKKYPRMIHMHRWDQVSMDWGTDPRLDKMMTAILGESPIFDQTMLYYKPAGARGQALHQDQFYLRAQPGTCCAAWLALDDCDEENGCLQVVPGSQDLPVLCTVKADVSQSFTDVTVPVPDGMEVKPVIMKRGDVLFFNGSLIHGSYANTSAGRFRRSLIGHYVTGNAQQVGQFFQPAYRMDGSQIVLEDSPLSTRCGIWVDQDGTPAVELIDAADHDRLVRHE